MIFHKIKLTLKSLRLGSWIESNKNVSPQMALPPPRFQLARNLLAMDFILQNFIAKGTK